MNRWPSRWREVLTSTFDALGFLELEVVGVGLWGSMICVSRMERCIRKIYSLRCDLPEQLPFLLSVSVMRRILFSEMTSTLFFMMYIPSSSLAFWVPLHTVRRPGSTVLEIWSCTFAGGPFSCTDARNVKSSKGTSVIQGIFKLCLLQEMDTDSRVCLLWS